MSDTYQKPANHASDLVPAVASVTEIHPGVESESTFYSRLGESGPWMGGWVLDIVSLAD